MGRCGRRGRGKGGGGKGEGGRSGVRASSAGQAWSGVRASSAGQAWGGRFSSLIITLLYTESRLISMQNTEARFSSACRTLRLG